MNSTEGKCLFCRYNAEVSGGRAGLQQHLQAVHRIQFDVELVMTVLLLSKEERTKLVAGARNQVNFDLNPEESSDKNLSKDEYQSDPVLKKIKLKRKSLSILESKAPVAGKIKFFKNLSGIEPAIDENKIALFSRTPKMRKENKRESLVNSLLKKTLTEHLQGQKSADDTIDMFDEIFAAVVDLDDTVEGPYNKLLLEEDLEVKNEREKNEENPNEDDGAEAETDTSSDSAFKEEGTDDGPEEALTKLKISPSRACSESLVFNTPTKQNGVYVCNECNKPFRFLTYLKSHRNSKYGCSGSGGKSASSGKKPTCLSPSFGDNIRRPNSGQKPSQRLSSM